ncbi:MAG TPA: hypothetical protein PK603_06640 [Bacteroidales bacterium]|nr:hypothetical protein [Bacteroidales bacterium]
METEKFNKELRKLVFAGAVRRYQDLTPAMVSRIETEVYAICEHGMAEDFVRWANHAAGMRVGGILVSVRTGTAPGSVVNYCLGITQVDPLRYRLLFERFFDTDCGDLKEVVSRAIEKDYVDIVKVLNNDFYSITAEPTDQKTWELIQAGDTEGCYMLGSRFAREQLAVIKPSNIFELTALESMLRPHNKELLPQYLVAKEQNGGWKCGIAAVDDLLSETYGLILYQEQVMRIAALVGNYSPHGTLSFMRTLFHGAEDDLWADCREEFIASATNNGYDVQKVQKLWERMEQFGSYIFNKSHAVCVALISYYYVYLRAHKND